MSDKTFYLIVGLLLAAIFTLSPNDYHKLIAALLVVILLLGYLRGAE